MDRLGDVRVEHLRQHPRPLVDEVDLQAAVAEVAGHLDAERRGADHDRALHPLELLVEQHRGADVLDVVQALEVGARHVGLLPREAGPDHQLVEPLVGVPGGDGAAVEVEVGDRGLHPHVEPVLDVALDRGQEQVLELRDLAAVHERDPARRVGDVGELGEEGHPQVRVQPLGDGGGRRSGAASADHDQALAHGSSVDTYSTAGGEASVFDTQHTRRARVTSDSRSRGRDRGARVDDDAAVAQLAAGALGARVDAHARQLVAVAARHVGDGEAEAARERGAEHLGRHRAAVLAARVLGLVDRDPVPARLDGRRVAALPGGGDLERVSQRRLPGTPRRRARVRRRRRPTCTRATTRRPPARSRSASAGSSAIRASARPSAAPSPGGREQRALAVGEEAAEHVEIRRDDRQPGRQRLERGESEALLHRRERERVGGPEQPLHRLGLERAEHAHVRDRRRARRPAPRTGRARGGSRTASCRPRSAAAGRARGRGRAAPRSRRAASATPCAARCRRPSSPRSVRRARPRPARARARRRRAPGGSARASTPLRTSSARTPYSSASRSTHGGDTHSRWSGSTIERSWHAISEGDVKSSTWWTVRITWSITPSSRSASAALADRQSWAWKTS